MREVLYEQRQHQAHRESRGSLQNNQTLAREDNPVL